jgi:hypothetical protein
MISKDMVTALNDADSAVDAAGRNCGRRSGMYDIAIITVR